MPSFSCPSFGLLRPAVSAPSDPAMFKVARVIYFGGRADGREGIESVAHVIQNRMNNSAFPNDALEVISAKDNEFQEAARQPMPAPQGAVDKQLFDRAKSMATQLLYHPRRLSFPDSTGGKLHHRDTPDSACHSADELSDGDDLSAPPASPRPVLPTRSRHPLGFLKDQTVAGISTGRRPYVDGGEGPATPSSTSRSGRPSATGHAPSTHAGDQPVRASTPPPAAPQSSSSAMTPPAVTPPIATSSSRLIGRSGRSSRAAVVPPAVRLGPADRDGYHDMVLDCGLMQDDVIDVMYRDLTPEDFEKLCRLDERVPKRPCNTAARNLVDSLPRVPTKDCGATQCSVCLVDYEPRESVVKLPCSHTFHHPCIAKWGECKNTCPLCSAPITSAAAAEATSSSGSARSSMRTL